MQTIQPAFTFVFGHLAPKPLTLSAETETVATLFYRNRKTDRNCIFHRFRRRSVSAPKPKPKPNFGRSLERELADNSHLHQRSSNSYSVEFLSY